MAKINTVSGSISENELGLTLMHEHILNDASRLWAEPPQPERKYLSDSRVCAEILHELKYDPYSNKDNLVLDSIDDAVYELNKFKNLGGATVIDAGNRYMGRRPQGLLEISKRTGLNIIMGTGYHLEDSMPQDFAARSIDDIAAEIISEITEGVDNTGIKPGIIGEIGIGGVMTETQRKSLAASCTAQAETGVPLTIHTDGWSRNHHQILEVVSEQKTDFDKVILEHMNPCWAETDYLVSLIETGVYLEFDMIGMDMYYPGVGQSPADEQVATAVVKLIEKGFGNRILLSHDVFLKIMLTKYGGLGYGHVSRAFVPRLKRLGVSVELIDQILIQNPKRIFAAAAEV